MFKLLCLIILTSCAQSLLVIDAKNVKSLEKYSSVTMISFATRDFEIVPVVDNRDDKSTLGLGLTGARFSETPIKLTQSLEEYVESYFFEGLKKRGFNINPESQNKLRIILNKIWLDEVIEKFKGERARCHVNIDLVLELADGTSWNSNFWTKITSHSDLSDGTDKIATTFASCMNEIVEQIVNNNGFIQSIR